MRIGVLPAPAADDAEFLRRVSLDLAGRIPSAGEVREFLDDPNPDRRRHLIDRLLAGPAYVAHFTTIEQRLLIPEAETNRQLRLITPAFEAWLRRQIAENVGYDRTLRDLLTVPVAAVRSRLPAQQPTTVRGQEPSPLAFYMAKEVKGENLAASTARLFLGLRLECAQCHNHPFATWKREQFWGYAAFFSSLERQGPPGAVSVTGLIREFPDRREATVPGTDKVVPATFLDGSEPNWRPQVPAREILAEWMVAPDNPYFSRAAVNRLWAHFFGIGLVDPVDDMGADNPPSHPELLDALARSFIEHGFDRKYLIRAIVLSRAYQLTSAVNGPELPEGAEAAHGPAQSEDPDSSRLFARMAGARAERRAILRQPGAGGRIAGGGIAGGTRGYRGEYAPRPVPGDVRPAGRAADRGADVYPAGPRLDERPGRFGSDPPRGGGDALGRR